MKKGMSIEKDKDTFEKEEADNESLELKGPIISYGADYTLDTIRQYVDNKQITVQPSFQRKFVWDIKKASKLIESFILGYPVPNILLGRDSDTEAMEVIDGQQRILSICDYFKGRFRDNKVFRLTGDVMDSLEGKAFDDLEESLQIKLRNAILKAVVLVYPKKDPDIKFTAFQRINTGSVILNQQEIRNCIYGGRLNDFLIDLNKNNETWRGLFGQKPDKRMKDVETMLRFYAAYYKGDKYEKPITSFLNTFMQEKRDIPSEEIEEWRQLFDKTLSIIVKNIGKSFPRTTKSKAFNRAVFESVMVAVARLKKSKKLKESKLKEKYTTLIEDETYLTSVTSGTSDKKNYKGRIEVASRMLS